MKIRIIGGGWYGAHTAVSLLDAGHDVTVFERGSTLFSGASGANQSRLHLGFHYPRCRRTRQEAIKGFGEFMAAYGEVTAPVTANVYAIAAERSQVDFGTYQAVMRADGVEFVTLAAGDLSLSAIEGAVLTGERLILQNHAREMFKRRLVGRVHTGVTVADLDPDTWDATINCTYGALPTPGVARVQPCILFVFEGPTHMAVTVMDGMHGCSVYPWIDDGHVSLTSVRHTPLQECESWDEVQDVLDHLTGADIARIRGEMVSAIKEFVPWFEEAWRPVGHSISVRALPGSLADRRTCHVTRDGRTISVLPGKISGIFEAERAVKAELMEMTR